MPDHVWLEAMVFLSLFAVVLVALVIALLSLGPLLSSLTRDTPSGRYKKAGGTSASANGKNSTGRRDRLRL